LSNELYVGGYENRAEIKIDGETWAEITEQFSTGLAETAPHKNLGDNTPRFTEPHGKYLYARLRAVHRYCMKWLNLKTVWLSLTADEKNESGEWVHPLRHDDGFRSSAVKQALYRARRRLDVEQWAGVWLMAPRKTGYSHRHYALWLDTEELIEQIELAFERVVESHISAHPYASADGNPVDQAVQVRCLDDCEKLLPEIAHNIPEIGPDTDVRNLSEDWQYARIWAALYSTDDRVRQYELGRFKEIADDARAESRPSGEWVYAKGWN